MSTEQQQAVVVGGGIGGLTAALALQRIGWAVTVVERAPSLQPVGAGLTIWPNAMHALAALKVADDLQACACALRTSEVRRPDGRRLSRMDGREIERRFGKPVMGVTRSDLVDVLAAALPDDALQLDAAVAYVDPGDARTRATVRGGGFELAADLVVAADGIDSRIRRTLWPDLPEGTYRGYTAWRGLVHAPEVAAAGGASETWGDGERFGIVPVGDDLVYVFATANTPPADRSPDGELAELQRRFGHWHDPIPALLAAIDPATLLRHDIRALHRPATPFHLGRVALLGDAAHAMEPNLGQGACQAIEDAVVLAHEISGATQVTAGLAGYSTTRADRVAKIAKQSHRLGRLGQSESRSTIALRNTFTRVLPERATLRSFDGPAGWKPPRLT